MVLAPAAITLVQIIVYPATNRLILHFKSQDHVPLDIILVGIIALPLPTQVKGQFIDLDHAPLVTTQVATIVYQTSNDH